MCARVCVWVYVCCQSIINTHNNALSLILQDEEKINLPLAFFDSPDTMC